MAASPPHPPARGAHGAGMSRRLKTSVAAELPARRILHSGLRVRFFPLPGPASSGIVAGWLAGKGLSPPSLWAPIAQRRQQLPQDGRRVPIPQSRTQRHRIDTGLQPRQDINRPEATSGDAEGQRGPQGLPQTPPVLPADAQCRKQLDDAAAKPPGAMHLARGHHARHEHQSPCRCRQQFRIQHGRYRIATACRDRCLNPLGFTHRCRPELQFREASDQGRHLLHPSRPRLPGNLDMADPLAAQPIKLWLCRQRCGGPQHHQQRLPAERADQAISSGIRRIQPPSRRSGSAIPATPRHRRFPSPPACRRAHRAPDGCQ